jgi:hypothetical protein
VSQHGNSQKDEEETAAYQEQTASAHGAHQESVEDNLSLFRGAKKTD